MDDDPPEPPAGDHEPLGQTTTGQDGHIVGERGKMVELLPWEHLGGGGRGGAGGWRRGQEYKDDGKGEERRGEGVPLTMPA